MAKIVFDNIFSKIYGNELTDKIHAEIDDYLSYKVQDARFILQNMDKSKKFFNKSGQEAKPWDGVRRLYWKKGSSMGLFYTGMLSGVVDVLRKNNIKFQFEDERTRPEVNCPQLKFLPPSDFETRKYQSWTIDLSYKASRGIIEAATGSGKTLIVTELISKIKTTPFLFVVLSTDLMEQAHDTLSSCLNIPIGKIGGGVCNIQDINVITVQTAIKALNSGNKEFKIKDYQYDDDDKEKWEDSTVESTQKAKDICKLITECKGIYFDECVSGDTNITTEKGIIKISQIPEKKCRFALTYDGTNIIWKPILNFWKKGIRKTIKIQTEFGNEIICTPEHPILTKVGWKQAGQILLTDEVLSVNADVKNGCQLINAEDLENIYSDTKSKLEQNLSGIKSIYNISQDYHYVNADVVKKPYRFIRLFYNLLNTKEVKNIPNTLKDMISSQYGMNIISNQQIKKNKPYWEHVLEILALYYLAQDLKTTDYNLTMALFRKIGLNIRQNFYQNMEWLQEFVKTVDMEINQLHHVQNVFRHLHYYQKQYIMENKRKLQNNYWKKSEILDSHGGYATMVALLENVLNTSLYIPKDGIKKRTRLWLRGLEKKATTVKFVNHKEKENNTTTYSFQNNQPLNYQSGFQNSFQNVCNTKWQKIKNISHNINQEVYDIEVKDTHCFFANNLLVHNCHHASSKTCREFLWSAKNSFWRYGGSATPYREDGEEMMLQALFGKKIVKINASYLIKHGYLVKPYIFDLQMYGDYENYKTYPSIYSHNVVNNKRLNEKTISLANNFESNGLTTLILVRDYEHGDNLLAIRPDIPFIKGDQSRTCRKNAINALRSGQSRIAIATSLADEGLDIRRLGAVIIAGGGKSITRVYQRVGRTLRTFENKDRAFIVTFNHHCKFLDKHGSRVYSLLKKEDEFVVKKSTEDSIMDDINNVSCNLLK